MLTKEQASYILSIALAAMQSGKLTPQQYKRIESDVQKKIRKSITFDDRTVEAVNSKLFHSVL
jgi:hypothetical protein